MGHRPHKWVVSSILCLDTYFPCLSDSFSPVDVEALYRAYALSRVPANVRMSEGPRRDDMKENRSQLKMKSSTIFFKLLLLLNTITAMKLRIMRWADMYCAWGEEDCSQKSGRNA